MGAAGKKKSYTAIGKRFLKTMGNIGLNSDPEKAVEPAVNQLIHDYMEEKYGSDQTSQTKPHNTDGLVTVGGEKGLFVFTNTRSVLIEVKKGMDFSGNKAHVAKVLVQVVYYLHAFKNNGDHIPDAVVVSDEDEMFVLNTALLIPYLDEAYDWTVAPSSAWKNNSELMQSLMENKNIRPHVFDIFSETFDTITFCGLVNNTMYNTTPEKIVITEKNLEKHFIDFSSRVFPRGIQDVPNQKQIEIFMKSLQGSDDVYIHPKNNTVLVLGGKNIAGVDADQYGSYWDMHDSNNYSFDELKNLVEICDTLIKENDRRFTGDFWTPKIWVDEAHRRITAALGDNWKEDRVVWSPAAGSKNLTRDYLFGDIYCSTLHEEELSLAEDYNKEGTSFQYDFLNDDIEMLTMTREEIAADPSRFKMPETLVQALLDKKPFVFFDNPPYGQATDHDGAKKGGIATTGVGALMKKEKMGHAQGELYTQFIWRVMKIREIFEYGESDQMDFFFFNKGFLTSPSFSVFTKKLTSEFTYKDGFMINAGEFMGTSSSWGIIFSHWNNGGTNQKSMEFDVLESDKNLAINEIGNWKARLVEKKNTISDWLVEVSLSKMKCNSFPLTKNGFDSPTAKSSISKMDSKWIGYLHNNGNNVQYSDKYTGIYSAGFASAHGRDITSDNLTRAMTVFSIRRSVQEKIAEDKQLWVRDKDIFTRPSDDLITPEFTADCMVYALFDRQSNQTSLRDYKYNGTIFRVINEFYPFSREDTIQWAKDGGNNLKIQQDASTDTDRIMHKWLEQHKDNLSTEASTLLDIVKNIYKDSMKHRDLCAQMNPRYQTNSWDAGWVQIQRMVFGNDRITDTLLPQKDAFTAARKTLGDKIAKAAMDDGVI